MSKAIVFLQGGLGNQMFQYAFYLALKEQRKGVRCDDTILSLFSQHNGSELERVFGIKSIEQICSKLGLRVLYKLIGLNHLRIRSFLFRVFSVLNINIVVDDIPSIYISQFESKEKLSLYFGYWQTEKYFQSIRQTILNSFCFELQKISNKTLQEVYKIDITNSVSIHIRRGDYLSLQNLSLYGGICTKDYYLRAIKIMEDMFEDVVFYVFSDDIEWVKANLELSYCEYIDWNNNLDSWQDMYLMSKCKHNIIANSSFSWWGAWLNENPNKVVVAPHSFLNSDKKSDIIPKEWIAL